MCSVLHLTRRKRAQAMFCNHCGTQLNPDWRFCQKCGIAIPATGLPEGGVSTRFEPVRSQVRRWFGIDPNNMTPRQASIGILVLVSLFFLIAVGIGKFSEKADEREKAEKSAEKAVGDAAINVVQSRYSPSMKLVSQNPEHVGWFAGRLPHTTDCSSQDDVVIGGGRPESKNCWEVSAVISVVSGTKVEHIVCRWHVDLAAKQTWVANEEAVFFFQERPP